MSQEKTINLNLQFDLCLDGDEITVFLEGKEVTSEVRRALGRGEFNDLRKQFESYQPEQYDIDRDFELTRELA